MELRGYQSRVASACENANTLVVLPTGMGFICVGTPFFPINYVLYRLQK